MLKGERGKHPEFVFTFRGEPLKKMRSAAWAKAWQKAGLPTTNQFRKGVHNLRHTFGHRLRAAGASLEDRQDLLWHTSGRVTTHYSAPDMQRLIAAVSAICDETRGTVLRAVGLSRANLGQNVGQTVAVEA